MRVVVVGATGNMGSALLRALAARGDTEVVGVARRPPEAGFSPAVEVRRLDIAEDDLVPCFRGADALFHLAWLFQPTHRPEVTWRVNVGGSARVFQAAGEAGVGAVVYASSVGAYSPGPGQTVDESWPTHSLPRAAYGREKAYVERLLDAFAAAHPEVRVVRFRPGFVFQPSSGSQQRRLFIGPFVPRRLLRPGAVPVLPWVQGLHFQAVHADDVAAAYCAALTSDASGAFNLAAEPVVDGPRLAELMGARLLELPAPVVRAAMTLGWRGHLLPSDPALLDLVLALPTMATDRARTQLGWEPRHSSLESLRSALQGLAEGVGDATAPLAGDSLAGRAGELQTGVGERP